MKNTINAVQKQGPKHYCSKMFCISMFSYADSSGVTLI